jgi:HTH-type transcriptional regulator/antitoxin HigA
VLRHEIEHVLRKHGREREIIDAELEGYDVSAGETNPEEQTANKAGADFCVPTEKMDSFYMRKHPYFSERDVLAFANRLQVHPGIVVGQLHNRTKDYRYLRKYLVKVGQHLLLSAVVDGWGEVAPVEL